jgi:hypothetical protein
MNFFYNLRTLRIGWVELEVNYVGDMHQNGNLKIILVHVLDLIMSFECIILLKVYAWKNGVIKNIVQKLFEFLFFKNQQPINVKT